MAGIASVWLWICWRYWRVAARFDDRGVIVRSFWRKYQIPWHEVSCFADGFYDDQAGQHWALAVVLADGRAVVSMATTRNDRKAVATAGKPATLEDMLAVIRQVAANHGIPAELTGSPGPYHYEVFHPSARAPADLAAPDP